MRLDDLGLLPAPFPVEELAERARPAAYQAAVRDRRALLRQPLRAQGRAPLLDERERRGQVEARRAGPRHPARLGLRREHARIVLSVPPGVEPRRVSVDAIEHWMIYQAHPGVGAILHVHAWIEGIAATEVNYPCGTEELATSVAELLAAEPDPAHAVIGLRNHGITATGRASGDPRPDRAEAAPAGADDVTKSGCCFRRWVTAREQSRCPPRPQGRFRRRDLGDGNRELSAR